MDECIKYFAYGSNINRHVLQAERKIIPTAAEAANLSGYRLVFNAPGVPMVEPVFANIMPSKDNLVRGVCYDISAKDFKKIKMTEGNAYDEVQVKIALGGAQQPISAVTFMVSESKTDKSGNLFPSKRYMQLLIKGALEWGFPQV